MNVLVAASVKVDEHVSVKVDASRVPPELTVTFVAAAAAPIVTVCPVSMIAVSSEVGNVPAQLVHVPADAQAPVAIDVQVRGTTGVGVFVAVFVAVAVAVFVAVLDGVGVLVFVAVPAGVSVCVAVAVNVAVFVGVGVFVAVPADVAVK